MYTELLKVYSHPTAQFRKKHAFFCALSSSVKGKEVFKIFHFQVANLLYLSSVKVKKYKSSLQNQSLLPQNYGSFLRKRSHASYKESCKAATCSSVPTSSKFYKLDIVVII